MTVRQASRGFNSPAETFTVTTGFSGSFPEGLEIGIVSEYSLGSGSNFYKIDVDLAVDFRSIVQVALVENRQLKEINKLESLNNDGK